MKLTIVDVFAESLYAGNQLAVVEDVGQLDSETMQDIAREMNFSETTFVINRTDERARVRIFTPELELPFAGHPTLGTAWVLTGGEGTYTLDLDVGPVAVRFAEGLGWISPPAVTLKDTFAGDAAAALIGLETTDLDTEFPIRFAEVGPKFVLIGLKNLAALKAAKVNETLYDKYLTDGFDLQCVFVFTSDSYSDDSDFAARMFFRSPGFREDPATGSANSAFAAYLKDLRGGEFEVVVDQGVEIKRPSRLYLKVGESIEVGGRVQEVLRGELT